MLNKKKPVIRTIALVCAFVMAVGLLAGCASGSNNGASNQAPVKISIMVPLFASEPPDPNSELFQKVEKFANVKLDINFVPSSGYADKLNVSIASNQLPQALTVLDMKTPTFISSVRSGMFWDVTDDLKTLPTLSKNYDPKTIKNAQTDGKNYGLPRARSLARIAMLVRKDWMANLGLAKPTNVEELYNLIKAFATEDPDKDGKANTVGLLLGADGTTGNLDHSSFDDFVCFFGGGNLWEDKDGKLTPTFMSEPYMKALKFFKKLYDEKLINQDFAAVKPEQVEILMDQDKGGIRFGMFSDAADRNDGLVKAKQKTDPALAQKSIAEAKMDLLDTIYQIKSDDGKIRSAATPGFNGVFAFSKTSVKSKKDLDAILNFFDKMDTPEGQAMIKWGIQDRHYTLVDGIATVVGDTAMVTKEVNCLWQLFLTNQATDRSSIKGKMNPMTEKILVEQADNMNNIILDPTVPIISDTVSTKGPALDKIINDARIKYIMGAIDDNGWKQAVDQWVKNGGDKVMQEYTDARNKSR